MMVEIVRLSYGLTPDPKVLAERRWSKLDYNQKSKDDYEISKTIPTTCVH
jgi:hypothetical protein